jgi:hypothetical protein
MLRIENHEGTVSTSLAGSMEAKESESLLVLRRAGPAAAAFVADAIHPTGARGIVRLLRVAGVCPPTLPQAPAAKGDGHGG